MRIYSDLADWYPLLTPLADYVEEAPTYLAIFKQFLPTGRKTLLELGAGAGHNAFYFRDDFELTLTDLQTEMLAMAQRNCPEALCVQGDMRTLRLGRQFDAVFIHDAINYLLTERDLELALQTAEAHLKPGGVLLIAPDYVQETFTPHANTDGTDGEGRSLRYLEWTWQRAGQLDRYVADYTLVMRTGDAEPVVVNDRHEEGLFPRATWLRLLADLGLEPLEPAIAEADHPDLFLVRKAAVR